MPSFTSSSETRAATAFKTKDPRPLRTLIAVLLLCAVVLEILGRVGFVKVSRIQRRIDADYHAAIQLPRQVGAKPTLLAVGNSLMLAGVEMDRLRDEIGSVYYPASFFVEQTEYLDWYYGLRRLFDSGARPSVVVLGLNHNHLVSNRLRGEYFARFLLETRDFPGVARAQHLDPTTATTWLFANLSGWFGARVEIRKYVLVRTLPDLGAVGAFVLPPAPPIPDAATIATLGTERFAELKRLCGHYGARFVFVIPPSLAREPYQATEQAAKNAAITLLIPYRPGEMPVEGYEPDHFHLNSYGAKLFTERLARLLLQP